MNLFQGFSVLVLSWVLFSSCATWRKDPYFNIHSGMSHDEVQQVLGTPLDRRFSGRREEWIFEKQLNSSRVYKIVIFESGKVVALADDQTANQYQHELQKAKTQAPQIDTLSY